MLADDDVTVTNENLQAALQAANIKVDTFMTQIYAQALGQINTKQLIQMFSGAIGSAGVAVAAGSSGEPTADQGFSSFLYLANVINSLQHSILRLRNTV